MTGFQVERNILNRNERLLPGSLEGLMNVPKVTERDRGGLRPPPRIVILYLDFSASC
jgi:hypothetical protein